jgi:hypothetical protein
MASKVQQLESRVARLEQELLELKTRIKTDDRVPWYEQIVGAFKNDPAYAEITRLGQAIRKAERRRTR